MISDVNGQLIINSIIYTQLYMNSVIFYLLNMNSIVFLYLNMNSQVFFHLNMNSIDIFYLNITYIVFFHLNMNSLVFHHLNMTSIFFPHLNINFIVLNHLSTTSIQIFTTWTFQPTEHELKPHEHELYSSQPFEHELTWLKSSLSPRQLVTPVMRNLHRSSSSTSSNVILPTFSNNLLMQRFTWFRSQPGKGKQFSLRNLTFNKQSINTSINIH